MNSFSPGTENFSFAQRLIYFFVSILIRRGDAMKESYYAQTNPDSVV